MSVETMSPQKEQELSYFLDHWDSIDFEDKRKAADGNSVILVDHDTQILSEADWIIEMGPGAGGDGGQVIAEGTPSALTENVRSKIGPFLKEAYVNSAKKTQTDEKQLTKEPETVETAVKLQRKDEKVVIGPAEKQISTGIFDAGHINLATGAIHTVKPLDVSIPKGRLTVVTGVSGSGKTTLILESLVPALEAMIRKENLPEHVRSIEAEGVEQVKLIDAAPIGINVRSTVATYANVHDLLRKTFAKLPEAKQSGYKAGDFSYNTGKLRCPVCDGTGVISLDVQFLPDVDIPCPECRGSRYAKEAYKIKYHIEESAVRRKEKNAAESRQTEKSVAVSKQMNETAFSLPELMSMDVNTALEICREMKMKTVCQRLQVLKELGLGYLTLGEETPGLSGGEAQRLKLASEMGKMQTSSVFVFDEPTIGLHPLDVQTLLQVFRTLIAHGATVIVIEHDLDVIRSADYIIDMGPGGGEEGGRIVAAGTPEEIKNTPESVTGRFL